MNEEIKKLYPQQLWENFSNICSVPHPSKHEAQLAAFLMKWAEKNKERRSYLSSRSSARSFIRNKATPEDLLELSKMIDEKLTEQKDHDAAP